MQKCILKKNKFGKKLCPQKSYIIFPIYSCEQFFSYTGGVRLHGAEKGRFVGDLDQHEPSPTNGRHELRLKTRACAEVRGWRQGSETWSLERRYSSGGLPATLNTAPTCISSENQPGLSKVLCRVIWAWKWDMEASVTRQCLQFTLIEHHWPTISEDNRFKFPTFVGLQDEKKY